MGSDAKERLRYRATARATEKFPQETFVEWQAAARIAELEAALSAATARAEAAEAKAARLEEALVAQRAFILHWTDDVNGGLKPTLGSLRSALDAVSAALEA